MRTIRLYLVGVLAIGVCACDRSTDPAHGAAASETADVATGTVDGLRDTIADNVERIDGADVAMVIDHGRLAKEAGVTMPASVVTVFNAPAVTAPLMQADPRIGLDLPIKVLAYGETHDRGPMVAFVTPEFVATRHAVADRSLLEGYKRIVDQSLAGIPEDQLSPTIEVAEGYGLIEWASEYSFAETVTRLKEVVLAQGDTVWFGEIDYQRDAAVLGVDIGPAILLLFGGPGPGGKAMAEFPKLGLDAFCQKLLVYETPDGRANVAFNDIVAFAELHYGDSNEFQQVINKRLKQTFSGAIKNP
ncbi:DUF302 domain-containing protein [bacterium]|nr:DUF302 domain-containing protein [bacterium]